MVQGIDVYRRFQGTINWTAVRNAGITAVWIKASQGNATVDAAFSPDPYVSGAKAAGLKVGLYNFCTNVAGPAADADVLAVEVNRLSAFDLAPMIDYEDASLPQTTAGVRSYLTTYCQRLKAAGIANAYHYMSGSWWAGFAPFTTAQATFGGVNVVAMDAEYSVNDGVEHPRTHYTNPIGAHQYTSTGSVSGVTGNVDRDNITILVSAKGVPDVELTDTITYTSRMDNSSQTVTVATALAAAKDLFDQLSKGNGTPGGGPIGTGPAGWWVLQFLIPDHTTLNNMAAQVNSIATAVGANTTELKTIESEIDALPTNAELNSALTTQLNAAFANFTTPTVDVNALSASLAPALAPLLNQSTLTADQVAIITAQAIKDAAQKIVGP